MLGRVTMDYIFNSQGANRMKTIVKELNGRTCPECGKICKTLSGLSKHLNSKKHIGKAIK